MNYEQTLEYLFTQLPMFSRVGAAAYKADLTNTIKLCEALGNPQHQFKSIHIAGTNGKGSTSHMLASILQTAGYILEKELKLMENIAPKILLLILQKK